MSRVLSPSVKSASDGDWSYGVQAKVEVRGRNWIIRSGRGLQSQDRGPAHRHDGVFQTQ